MPTNRILKRLFVVIAFLLVVVVLPLLAFTSRATKAQIQVNGSIEYKGEQRILNLWGSNYEMGYADGYLLADEIANLIEYFLFGTKAKSDLSIYNSFLTEIGSKFTFPQEYQDQLQGVLAGMRDSGKDIYVNPLGREVNIDDLKLWNSFLDFTGGCASFAVWNNSSSTGETIQARNFNYGTDSAGYFVSYTLLRVVNPSDSSLSSWTSVGWPGFIGAISGLNQYGVTISANYGADGQGNPSNIQNLPIALILRSSLEKADLVDTVSDVYNIVSNHQKRTGVLVQLSYPSKPEVSEASVVFETDAYGTVIRYSDFDFPGYDHVIAKNHFVAYETPIDDPAASVLAYQKMADLLIAEYGRDDGKVDFNEARNIIRQISSRPAHNIIVIPNQLKFELAIRKPDNTLGVPQTYTWSELFPNHGDVTPTPQPQNVIYVSNIEMRLTTNKSQTKAVTRITISDATGAPLVGAQVNTHWTGLTTDSDSGVTDSTGKVILASNSVSSSSIGFFTVTVDSVTKDGWVYNPNLNIETSDSINLN